MECVLETNRGYHSNVLVCDWGNLTYSKIKKFNLERIFEDLEWMGQNKIGYGIITLDIIQTLVVSKKEICTSQKKW